MVHYQSMLFSTSPLHYLSILFTASPFWFFFTTASYLLHQHSVGGPNFLFFYKAFGSLPQHYIFTRQYPVRWLNLVFTDPAFCPPRDPTFHHPSTPLICFSYLSSFLQAFCYPPGTLLMSQDSAWSLSAHSPRPTQGILWPAMVFPTNQYFIFYPYITFMCVCV